MITLDNVYERKKCCTWMAQSVKCLTLAEVMISQFAGSSPKWALSADSSLEPALDSVSPCFSAPPPLALSFSLSKINIKKNFLKKEEMLSMIWHTLKHCHGECKLIQKFGKWFGNICNRLKICILYNSEILLPK